jgi:hypothetical protein
MACFKTWQKTFYMHLYSWVNITPAFQLSSIAPSFIYGEASSLLHCTEIVKFYNVTTEIMNPHNGVDDNKNTRTKAIAAAAIPMAGIMVAAALLSGLSLLPTYTQPALAQQNMTATNATGTTTGGGGGETAQSACTPTQTTGGGGGQNATTNATTTGGGGATNASGTTDEQQGTQSTSEVRLHIEEACMAAQSGDMQGVLMHLNLALNALGSNMTTTTGGGGATNASSTLAEVLTEGGNTTVGNTTGGSTDEDGE